MKTEQILETIARPMTWPVNVRRWFMIGLPITLPVWIVLNVAICAGMVGLLVVLFTLTGALNMVRRMWQP